MTDTTPTPAVITPWAEYTTQPFDAMLRIAGLHGIDLVDLMKLNPRVANPYAFLPVGKTIYLS